MDFAVIFDSDGVVVDSEPFSLSAFRRAASEQGVELSDEDVMANCGLTDADIIDYIRDKFGVSINLERFHHRKQELYEQLIENGELRPCPGAVQLLDGLDGGKIPYALASSGSKRKIGLNLVYTGLLDRFPVIISGEDMERGKPHPDIFLLAAERLGMEKDRCVVIEDSLNGIDAAHRAGMLCVAVTGTFPPDTLSRADFIVESLLQITVGELRSLLLNKNLSKGGNGSC